MTDKHIIQIHMLRSLPANMANIGNDGAPKWLNYGGSMRYRLSSQAVKAGVRKQFREFNLGVATRTAVLPELVRNFLLERGEDAGKAESIALKLAGAGKSAKKGKKAEEAEVDTDAGAEIVAEDGATPASADQDDQGDEEARGPVTTKTLYLLSDDDVRRLALHLSAKYNQGSRAFALAALDKLCEDFIEGDKLAPDVALFGRFSTDKFFRNVTAAVSMAHPFTTNSQRQQVDFFIAREEHELGVVPIPMVGELSFASGVYYYYASIDLGTLLENVPDVRRATTAAEAFLRAMVSPASVPSGKEHGMSVPTAPDLVVVEKVAYPLSYAPAFERSVWGVDGKSVMEVSAARLMEYIISARVKFGFDAEQKVLSMLGGIWQSDDTLDDLVRWAFEDMAALQESAA